MSHEREQQPPAGVPRAHSSLWLKLTSVKQDRSEPVPVLHECKAGSCCVHSARMSGR